MLFLQTITPAANNRQRFAPIPRPRTIPVEQVRKRVLKLSISYQKCIHVTAHLFGVIIISISKH